MLCSTFPLIWRHPLGAFGLYVWGQTRCRLTSELYVIHTLGVWLKTSGPIVIYEANRTRKLGRCKILRASDRESHGLSNP